MNTPETSYVPCYVTPDGDCEALTCELASKKEAENELQKWRRQYPAAFLVRTVRTRCDSLTPHSLVIV